MLVCVLLATLTAVLPARPASAATLITEIEPICGAEGTARNILRMMTSQGLTGHVEDAATHETLVQFEQAEAGEKRVGVGKQYMLVEAKVDTPASGETHTVDFGHCNSTTTTTATTIASTSTTSMTSTTSPTSTTSLTTGSTTTTLRQPDPVEDKPTAIGHNANFDRLGNHVVFEGRGPGSYGVGQDNTYPAILDVKSGLSEWITPVPPTQAPDHLSRIGNNPVSADGSTAVYLYQGPTASGSTDGSEVFVWSRNAGPRTLPGVLPKASSMVAPAIDALASTVAFGGVNPEVGSMEVYVTDLSSGITRQRSTTFPGTYVRLQMSADGNTIIYLRKYVSDSLYRTDITILDLRNGTETRVMTPSGYNETTLDDTSADGSKILLGRFANGMTAEQLLLDTRSLEETLLPKAPSPHTRGYCCLNASGSEMLIGTDESLSPEDNDGRSDVYLYRVQTGDYIFISRDSSSSFPITGFPQDLSEDGTFAAFGAGYYGLFVVPVPRPTSVSTSALSLVASPSAREVGDHLRQSAIRMVCRFRMYLFGSAWSADPMQIPFQRWCAPTRAVMQAR